MNKVTVNKTELLSILADNLLKHTSEYNEATQDYIDAVLLICQNNLKLAEHGESQNFGKIKSIPSKPESYTSDYKKAIRMLELSIDDNVTLSEHEFSQLVLDEWNWKHLFATSNMNYKTIKGI